MNWNSGFSALYELKKVDPATFLDAGPLTFTAGTIDNATDGLMQSADLTMTDNPGECWVRVYLKARQESGGACVPLFTGLTSAPEKKNDGVRETYNVECYSVLKPIDDILVPRGFYAMAGANGPKLVKELLSKGPAPVVVDSDGPDLAETIVAEDNQSNLDVAWLILKAIGWRLRIDGDGTIHVSAAAVEPSATFDTTENDVIEPAVSDTKDWYSVPNCIRVVSGENYVEYKDDDALSATSTAARKANRGGNGEIWMNDTASTIGDNESLAEYAIRVLKDAQDVAHTVSYNRRYRPDVFVNDLIQLNLSSVGIVGNFRVKRQTITLGYGCRMSEEVTAV